MESFKSKFPGTSYWNMNWTDEAAREFRRLKGRSGCYSFWIDESPLYVGQAKNLSERIRTSLIQCGILGHPDYFGKPVFLRSLETGTLTDMCIAELYWINKLQPQFNSTSKHDDTPSISIQGVPGFGEMVPLIEYFDFGDLHESYRSFQMKGVITDEDVEATYAMII